MKLTVEGIILEHGSFIRRTLVRLGICSRELPDVEQDVLRGIHRGLPTFDPNLSANPDNAVRAWLFGICQRQAASHRRKTAHRGELIVTNDELDNEPMAGVSVEERLVVEEGKAWLHEALDRLEPDRRAVIVAYELHGIAMADVAAAFSIPVNTAWNRLRLARKDLREAWIEWSKEKVR